MDEKVDAVLLRDVMKMQGDISDDEKCEIRTKLEIKKQSLEQMIRYKTQGSIIRSRTRWYNEGIVP